jgi:hypothetical protein
MTGRSRDTVAHGSYSRPVLDRGGVSPSADHVLRAVRPLHVAVEPLPCPVADRGREVKSLAVGGPSVIVVATADFELYHEVVGELRDRGVTFTTVEPDEPLPEGTRVVITAVDESLPPTAETETGTGTDEATVDHVTATAATARRGVESALAALRTGGGRTVVGVDPGTRPGVAVFSGDLVVAAFQVPLADVVDVVRREVDGGVDPLVRVGDGDRLRSARIVNALADVPVELVDESGTTPYLGTGARGVGDILAAVNIGRLNGERVDDREIEPTDGELQRIKDRSRRASDGDRTIDDALARRVAEGDLTVEEALAEHREDG